MSTVGYSGKPLAEKLGIKPAERIWAINPPDHYRDLLGLIPPAAEIHLGLPSSQEKFIHLFVRTREDLADLGPRAVELLAPGGTLWLCWPKKSSRLFVDVTEDSLRDVLLTTGVVDVKVCAVDADWSGLKFLWRRAKQG